MHKHPLGFSESTDSLRSQFQGADPFDHVVIDNFLDEEFAQTLAKQFPTPTEKEWWKYDNPLEKKLAYNDISTLPECFSRAFEYFNSPEFLSVLETITGIESLKCDPSLLGGGLHCILPGGKLDVHQDFNVHKGIMKLRKVNLIVYLNESWHEDWGGNLELWNRDMTVPVKIVSPVFNRAVIFRTDMESNHGHPRPLACPEGRSRNSLATYYYVEDSNIETIPYRSTVYKKLPGADDGLDDLREMRSKGRLSNSTSKA